MGNLRVEFGKASSLDEENDRPNYGYVRQNYSRLENQRQKLGLSFVGDRN
jgi:hypothetical protein